jgi:hypothetical protein
MLDQKVFRDAWALLCDRFGRERSTPLMLAYYKTLSPSMTTDQFRAACQRIFVEREFFPRPADFLEAVRPDPKASALEQWEQVHELMRGYPANLSAEARRVVAMLGGEHKLRMTPLDAIQYVRRDFMELYGDAVQVALREAGNRVLPTPEGSAITAALMEGSDAVRRLRSGNVDDAA